MASITDCIAEGLKYPLGDIKKLLTLGVLLALINLISLETEVRSFDIFTMFEKVSQFSLQSVPANDVYILIFLAVISFIISLFVMGYQYDVIRFSIERKEDLPGFSNILAVFRNGLKFFIVTLAYNIIPIMLFAAGVVIFNDNMPIFWSIILISTLMSIIANFLLIMAWNNMVAYDDIKKAFDLREITANIANLGWIKYIGTILFAIIVLCIIMIAADIIFSFLTVIFAAAINNQALIIAVFLGIIEGLFVKSYFELFVPRVCGSIYRESVK